MSDHEITEVSTYLTFGLDEEIFAFEVTNVREVQDVTDLTRVPRMPDFMRGVINLRGSVVPVVDMRVKFGLLTVEETVDTCIIVVEVELDSEVMVIGALVDSVKAVFDLAENEIEPPPSMGTRLNTDFIRGMGRQEDHFVIILNADQVFSADELSIVCEAGDTSFRDEEEEIQETISP